MYPDRSSSVSGVFDNVEVPRPASILIVDDTASAREPLARLLRMSGYRATCAADGAEALEAVRRETPDLVLLDLMMPRVDGLAFLRGLRQDRRWDDVPVLVITAAENPEQISAALALGACDCLLKAAFTVPELLDRIARTLRPA